MLYPSREQRDWNKFTAPWYKNEQKSTDKIELRFKVGDWVVNKFGDSWHIDSLDKKNYQYLMEKETIIIFLYQNETKCISELSKM